MRERILGISGGFAYRHNINGMIDAICLRCFLTAGSAPGMGRLQSVENAHRCEPTQRATIELWALAYEEKRSLPQHALDKPSAQPIRALRS